MYWLRMSKPANGKDPADKRFDEKCGYMKLKYRILFEILLLTVAVSVLVYNLSLEREIVYISSVVAVFGMITLLIRDIVKVKKDK